MALKPVCVPCQRFLKPFRTGARVLEQMPLSNGALPGLAQPELWQPYKIWVADIWRCPGCGATITVGSGQVPIAEQHEDAFAGWLASLGPRDAKVNDC